MRALQLGLIVLAGVVGAGLFAFGSRMGALHAALSSRR